ncbi:MULTISPECIES: 2Fe-2S iron-sulfur cluster-binding protein [unclassified Streptomyces]|uniref:2Fe-2S iron-sulfur cluster-binding protein n=1 Tax=unclassified Streptomyces TaxID=2593676 RepID=UPI001F04A7FA|nr:MULTISPECIES: 2Fe-2S iron-sulfur cluster-binding protein [unclassified Streptomyces]MCH0564680.1 2Fe-2S iron-sulfur cluster binding domain-containing protein [Streptomyces sp. MUM 2J]MCH0570380.1 2Fe-2S iron-sulfur cluster binding domain-containing protein [Streptomyces sp. MUM 136J]
MTMLQTHRGHWFRLRVSRIEALLEDTVAVTLHVPAELAAVFTAEPGRHVVVRHRPADGREVRRAYSVCPPPGTPDALRLVIRRHSPDGFGAYAGSLLAPGDEIEISSPTGRFGLPALPGGHHVLIAGGTGITPLAAMAAGALRASADCRVSLVHAVRSAGTALLADELAELKDEFTDRLTVLYVLSRERRESDLFTGRVDEERLRRLLTLVDARPDDATAFRLCGPAGLVETVRTALTAWGARPDRVRWELFSAAGAAPGTEAVAPAEPSGRVRAVIGGRSTVVAMEPGDRVVLDAVLRARPEVPYACRDGVCGSCRAKVVAGAVTLGRQHVLDDRDLAQGYTLACRARPGTDDLTLDFDA